jgi:hypothetical protein
MRLTKGFRGYKIEERSRSAINGVGIAQSIQDAHIISVRMLCHCYGSRTETYAQTTLPLLLFVTAPAAEPQDSFLLSEA